MRVRLERFLRIVGTGFCFLLFGFLGLLVLCFVFPFMGLVFSNNRESHLRVRNLLHYAMRWFVWVMVVCGTISYEVRHREKLARQGLLVVANHPSLIDVVLLISLLRQTNCVVKASLATNIFTRGPVRSAGFIVNSEGMQLIDDCIASVRAGDNLVIFPEGTRSLSHDGALSPMKRGVANVALRGGIDLTPVVITVSEPMLGKGLRWYQAPVRRPHFILTVMDDIPVSRYRVSGAGEENDSSSEAYGALNRQARALTRDLHAFFVREIGRRAVDGGRPKAAMGSGEPCA
jgi:1-acyl-sn-glycerol-3-phosphate acyltransferase